MLGRFGRDDMIAGHPSQFIVLVLKEILEEIKLLRKDLKK